MDMNFWVILIVALGGFVGAAIWFGPLFGNLWMKIHGWENMSKAELKAQEKGMWKYLLTEAITSFIMMYLLAFFIIKIPGYYEMAIAFFLWIGFIVPSVVSTVIWGGDKKEWKCTKIALLCGFNFIALMLAAYIYSIWL